MHLMKTKNGEMNMYNMEKQHKLGKLHALEPVSYTHLDVYKRQIPSYGTYKSGTVFHTSSHGSDEKSPLPAMNLLPRWQ